MPGDEPSGVVVGDEVPQRAAKLFDESGKNLGLRGGSGEWVMEAAVEDGGADLEHAVCAAR